MLFPPATWDKILCSTRERQSTTPPVPWRNPFDMDYERVVGSSSVRRLQDKTQVFPLQEGDFTRTRLTHSLEVSSLARSIGRQIAYRMNLGNKIYEQLPSLLAAAGLVHDLGNPPFGHYGEQVIRNWAKKLAESDSYGFDSRIKDYIYFDGNAQTIRILTRLQNVSDKYGMNFCYGTLAALLKNPWSSALASFHNNKAGYFSSESRLLEPVMAATGMAFLPYAYRRNPVTYLLEAADDIAYLTADLEDGAKKRLLPDDVLINELVDLAIAVGASRNLIQAHMKAVENFHSQSSIHEKNMAKWGHLRVVLQGRLINLVCDEFIANQQLIFNGAYKGDLLRNATAGQLVKRLRSICSTYIYNNREVLSLELVGEAVLTSLLNMFTDALFEDSALVQGKQAWEDPKTRSGKYFALISDNFREVALSSRKNLGDDLDNYSKVQLIVDYISGMSDSFALNLHRILSGVALP